MHGKCSLCPVEARELATPLWREDPDGNQWDIQASSQEQPEHSELHGGAAASSVRPGGPG